jgi:hypothetical protein
MAGYGVKDANRELRFRKDRQPQRECPQCNDGYLVNAGQLVECPYCSTKPGFEGAEFEWEMAHA